MFNTLIRIGRAALISSLIMAAVTLVVTALMAFGWLVNHHPNAAVGLSILGIFIGLAFAVDSVYQQKKEKKREEELKAHYRGEIP